MVGHSDSGWKSGFHPKEFQSKITFTAFRDKMRLWITVLSRLNSRA